MNQVQINQRTSPRLLPKIPLRLQYPPETARHSPSCIVMQPRQNDEVAFSGIWTGKGVGNGGQAPETR